MAQSTEHERRILDLDDRLAEDTSFSLLAHRAEGRARNEWYSRTLSALALLTDGQELRFVYGTGDTDTGTGRVVVITDKLFVFANIENGYNPSERVLPRAFRRDSIQSIAVVSDASADERVASRKESWPGYLALQVSYAGIPITFSGEAYDGKSGQGQIWTVLDDLREDLAGG